MRPALSVPVPALLAVALALVLAVPARADGWSTSAPLADLLAEDGTLLLAAGAALRIDLDPGDPAPTVRAVGGEPVPTLGLESGLLVPAAGGSRLLVVTAAPGTEPKVRTIERRGITAAWTRFERQAGRGRATAEPPWPAPGLADALALRAAAVADGRVARLGLAEQVALRAPLVGATHTAELWEVEPLEPMSPMERTVSGPAVLVVRSQPVTDGRLVRYTLLFTLDGAPWGSASFGSTGTAPRSTRIWVPPGRHRVGIGSPDVAGTVVTEAWRLRPRLGRRVLARAPSAAATDSRQTKAAAAEATWLLGDHAGAVTLFRELLAVDDAPGRLARARVIEGTNDPDELVRLCSGIEFLSDLDNAWLGRDATAAAVLQRAAELPPDVVLAAVRGAEVDPETLGGWLDSLGGTRPRGLALFDAATPPIEAGPSLQLAAARERSLGTRWTRLDAEGAGDGNGAVEGRVDGTVNGGSATSILAWSDTGPGLLRGRLRPGQSTTLVLPEVVTGRVPLLRLHALGPVTFGIDGRGLVSVGGRLDFGLSPGPHQVTVDSGELIVLDPELAAEPTGLLPAYEWRPAPLPATFDLPDPGWAVDLRVLVEPPGPVRVELDDGTVANLEPDDLGVVRLRAGPHAARITITSTDGEAVLGAVDIATANLGPVRAHPGPPPDVEAALVRLAELSRRIGSGDIAARVDRAELLGTLSLRGAAERDLRVVLATDQRDLRRLAWRTLANLQPDLPTAQTAGPATVEAALALAGIDRPPPLGTPAERAAALEALAEHTPEADGLWAAVSTAWEEADDLPRAARAALLAGAAGEPNLARLALHGRWFTLPWPMDGTGLVPVALPTPGPEPDDAPLWRRAREAMLDAPWDPSEAVVLRGPPETSDLVVFEGTEATLELFCRDEEGPDRPCATTVRFDKDRRSLSVPSGAVPEVLRLEGAPGRHEIEVSAAGEGFALVIAASHGGQRLPPQLVRSAHRATERRPVRYTVAAPAVVELEAVRGEASVRATDRATNRLVSHGRVAPGETLWLPLVDEGVVFIQVRGDADLVVRRAEVAASRDIERLPGPPPPTAALSDAELLPLITAVALPPPARLPEAGSRGTWRLGAEAARDALYAPSEPWWAGQTAAAWMRAVEPRWTVVGAWLRGPQVAGGMRGELGRRWTTAYAGVGADGAWASGVAGSAGHVELRGRARDEVPVGSDLALRGDLGAAAGWWSAEPVGRVDPQAWSRYHAQHPARLWAGADLVWHPARDLVVLAGPRVRSNTGPSLDRFGAAASADLLLGGATRMGLDAVLWRRLADADRAATDTSTRVALGLDHTPWLTATRRLELGVDVAWRPLDQDLTASVSASLLLSPHRGLSDLPPASTPFRTLLEGP